MRMKKFLTFLLTFAMVVSLLPASAFAANNTATTMRLAKTQGTVAVTNATGKQVTQTSNMKLYNGYQIKTGAKSYAWISLDDTKAAKLDANSVVSVQKSGQKLTLYLSSGNIFFNVKEKLSGGESFHIKTSTMTTGIRGTSGCVRVVNPRVTEIHLLTGQINVYTENPELHISKTAVLTAGQKAYSLIAEEAVAATGEQADIIIETLTSHEVCGNCSVEIAADPELVERIEEEAPHLLPEKIADEAEDRLEADEQAAEEKQAAIEEAVNNQTLPEDVDPYFEKEESSGGGGGGGSSAVVDSNTVYAWDELVAKINEFNAGSEDMTITLGENLPNAADLTRGTPLDLLPAVDNAAGKTLTLNLSTYILGLEDTWVNHGDLIITNEDGMIGEYADPDAYYNVIDNYGNLTLKRGALVAFDQGCAVANNNGATFIMEGGAIKSGEISINGSSELEFMENTAQYSEGVRNYDGAYTEISGGSIETFYGILDFNTAGSGNDVTITGGTFHVPASGYAVSSAGNVKISGGTVTAQGTDPVLLIEEGGELNITGGTFSSGGTLIQNDYGTFSMTGGTINMKPEGGTATDEVFAYYDARRGTATFGGNAKITIDVTGTDLSGLYDRMAAFGISSLYSTLTMTGGTIEVNGSTSVSGVNVYSGKFEMTGGTIKVNSTDGRGVYSEAETVLTGGTILAAAGTAVEAADDPLTLGEGTTITATGDANAVVLSSEDIEVTRPIKADISTEKFTAGEEGDPEKNGLFYPMLDFLHEDGESAGTLWDRYGEVYDMQSLNYWIGEFNDGAEDMTLTFADDIAHETGSMAEVENNGYTLTIDLGSHTLSMKDTGFMNRGKLIITGDEDAVIQQANGQTASYLLRNQGELTVDGVELVVPANGTGIAASNATSGMDNKVTVENSHIDATAAGAEGIRIANLGSLVPVLDFTSSTMEVGNGTDTTAMGIQTLGGTVTITGTAAEITVNSGTGISADDNDNGIDGIVNANGGTMTVSGSAKGIAVEGGGDVTMKGMGMELQDADGATAVSVAAGGVFEGESRSITFRNPSENSVGIHVMADAEATLSGTYIQSSYTGNENLKMIFLDGTADAAAILNMSDGLLRGADHGSAIHSSYGIVNVTGGTLTTAGTPGYIIYAENSTVNVEDGEFYPASGGTDGVNYSVYLVGSALNFDGGEMHAGYTDNLYNHQFIYGDNNSEVNLTGGTIEANTNQAVISIEEDTDLTLGDAMTVKRYQADAILDIRVTDTGLYAAEGPADGYYTLILAANALNAADRFIAQVIAFNDGEDDVEIQLTEDVDLTTAEKYTMPDEIGDSSSDTKRLTIDLNNYNLILASQLNNHGLLSIRDDSVGENGVITGKEGVAITYLIANSGEMEWNNGTLKATADNTYGIANTGRLHVYDGVISIQDDSASNSKAAICNMGTSVNSVVNITGGHIWAQQAGTGNVTALKNNGSGTTNLTGGDVKVEAQTDNAIAVSNSATMLMSTIEGGTTIVQATADGAIGILNSNGDFTLEDGEVNATAAGAVAFENNNGATLTLTGGSITAEETGATALQNVETISTAVGTVVQAVDDNRVCVGTLPEGYEVSDTADGGYYYMVAAASSTLLEVYDADDMVTAFETVNGSENTYTIRLMNDVSMESYINWEGTEVAYEELDVIGTTDTTLDLNGSKLTLGSTLTNDGTLAITDSGTGGSITGDVSVLIDNGGNLTWDYGNMIVSAANGVGLENSGTAVVGNGSQNSATLISLTGSGATGIQVTGGEVTVDGMQIGTSASQSQTGILVAAGADLTVDSATIYALTGNTGIENNGTAILNGASLSANAGNTGTLVKNTGDLTVDGGSMTTNSGAAVYQTAGMVTMDSGTITTTAYNVGGLELYGGTANLNGGNIKVNNNGGGEIGVSMNNSTLNLDGTVITVNGSSATGIRGAGTMNLESGTVTAENAGAVAIELVSGGSGTSITLGDAVKIRAMTEANVLTPDDTDLGFVTEDRGDGYFYLAAE